MAISPIQLARTPELLSSLMSTSQINSTNSQLLVVEQQLSTGQKFANASDDPADAAVTMQLSRTLSQQQTYLANLGSAQNQLGEVDNSLSNLTTIIQQAQSIASADVNTGVTAAQRQADAQIVDTIYNQALGIANTQYNGQYLFGGTNNTAPPYSSTADGVQFNGSSQVLQTQVDASTAVAFMVSGPSVFGGLSTQVQGSANLTPNLTLTTRISDLRGATGDGVNLGTIQIGNGTKSALVNLSNADTIGDVINAINAAGVGGITASLSGEGISLTGSPTDNITVNDVGGDHTADQLGILQTTGAGAGTTLIGSSAQANVTVFTPLAALNGGAGIDKSGITINNGSKSASLSFANAVTVGDLLNAINGADAGIKASIDPSGTSINIQSTVQGPQLTISENGGTTAANLGVQSFSPQTKLSSLNGGKGVNVNPNGNDFSITASDGTTYNVSLNGAQTVSDAIHDINVFTGGAVQAAFSTSSNAITLTDTTGGSGTLTVTPTNGSTAAADLGLTQNVANGNTITGIDVNPITTNGLFSDLKALSDALNTGDVNGITAAAGALQNDYQTVVDTRGEAGAQVQGLQNRTTQITSENTTTQALMSQLSDTDFTAAITRFQQLQTALQASLETAAKTLNLSLINFLS